MRKKLQEYKGAIHIHTNCSDGSIAWDKVITSAKEAKLDYIIITDHNTLVLKDKEGWYGNTLLLVGEEITPQKSHYLAMGIHRAIYPDENSPLEYIKKVKKEGGIGFIVHPFYQGKKHFGLKGSPWQDFEKTDGFTGIELWSWMHDWVESVNLFNILYYWIFPHRSIEGPSRKLLNIWDNLTLQKRVPAIGGLDVHGRRVFLGVTFFPYKELFKTLRTHILTTPFKKDTASDSQKVYNALKNGNCWMANDYLSNSEGFSFKTSKGAIMGEKAKFQKGLRLEVNSPCFCLVRIVHKGKPIFENKTKNIRFEVKKPGPYRVEATIDGKSWLFTNPIYIK